jgi:metal-responsive CopG/Arc/MetJ family transcriptional regulator
MKVKTSITLSKDILEAIDRIIVKPQNRSAFIENLKKRAKKLRDEKDLEILNKRADRLNREVEDVLSNQVEL